MQQIFTGNYFTNLVAILLMVLISMIGIRSDTAHAATFNSGTGELSLPHLINGPETLTEVILKLNTDGTYAIQNGTNSTLPFYCPGKFSKDTFNIIKSAKNKNEINSLLGCRWYSQQKSFFDASDNSPAFSWLDSSCQTLSVVINESSGEMSSSLEQNHASCNLYSAFLPYDINSEILYLQYVKIDNSITASDVYIKFYNGKYEIVSYKITPNTNLPVICDLLTEADYDAISATMTLDEINNKLGCQWATDNISDYDSSISYGWIDHEWNQITVNKGSINTKIFQQFRVGEILN